MKNITQESVCNSEMETADFLARLRNRKWEMRKTVRNIADFRFFSVSLYENLDKLNAE
ncbi:hypothetical protein G1K66_12295 [Tenacibaculum finnmarkense]|uniref:hypothetical protein n=1 Tax=Tenacibaculum finnmarkense TaxID=2781243 RepID=UPI001EFB7D34|nr:hypothetical protein [Tenacibaculum finnmarkense]MCG8814036.1 hypothetical protein [Tenacibaculum finnmarkense]